VQVRAESGATLPGNISANTTYFTLRQTGYNSGNPTFKLATSKGGSPIAHSSDGSGTLTLVRTERSHAKSYSGFSSTPNSIAEGGFVFTASGHFRHVVAITLTGGGTGYAVGDEITINDNPALSVYKNNLAAIKVREVGAGGTITTAQLWVGGEYENAVSSPTYATTGSGSGATFTLTWSDDARLPPRGAMAILGKFDYGIDFLPVNRQTGTEYKADIANHAIRLPNGTTSGIAARNAAGNDDVPLMHLDSSDKIKIGNATPVVVTGAVAFGDGSATSPAITNDGDENTGLYFPAANTLAVTTNGTRRATFSSDGRLGLNVDSPGSMLHIKQGSIYIDESGNNFDNRGWCVSATSNDDSNGFTYTRESIGAFYLSINNAKATWATDQSIPFQFKTGVTSNDMSTGTTRLEIAVGNKLIFGGGPTLTWGTGAPTATEPNGSLYMRTDGTTASTRLYVSAGAGTWNAVTAT
jgi:hypothetical protein